MTTQLSINEVDVTDYILDKSMSVSRLKLAVTLVGYTAVALDDGVLLTGWIDDLSIDWSGYVTGIDKVAYTDANATTYYTISAENTDTLEALATSGSPPVSGPEMRDDIYDPVSWNTLQIKETWNAGTSEVRGTAVTNDAYWQPGMQFLLTSTEYGLTEEMFTIMDTTVTWPTRADPLFSHDLGLGDFATATTGASNGGPLTAPTLKGEVGVVATTTIEAAFTTPTLKLGPVSLPGTAHTLVRSDATIGVAGTPIDAASKLYLYSTRR